MHALATIAGEAAARARLEGVLEITAPPRVDRRGSALALAAYWLFVPYLATARFLLYIDVRTRAEGWDVQTRFAAIAARGEEGHRVTRPRVAS